MLTTTKDKLLIDFVTRTTKRPDSKALKEKYPSVYSDVLKVSHHGSSTSSEMAFLKAVSPKVAVISVGRNNRFGHPHDEVLERLEYLGIPVARTDEGGAIKVVFDETGPKWYSYRCQRNCF